MVKNAMMNTRRMPDLADAKDTLAGVVSVSSSAELWTRVMRVLGVAILYLLTAKLGFLMAIHPGNVTAVWPPSGIALAALLLWGQRLWPGILLGSFLANTWVFRGMDLGAVDIVVGGCIAVGSVLQALSGDAALRWWIGASYGRLPDEEDSGYSGRHHVSP